MHFFRGSSTIPAPFPNTVLTIGNFDGVHIGHQMLIAETVERAHRRGGTPALMTFDPPPARVLGRVAVPQIMTLEDKREVVEGLGIEVFVCETFNLAFASTPPKVFMEDFLERRIHPGEILVGYDFCFGKQREGNFEVLKRYFEPRGCHVHQFSALTRSSESRDDEALIVSSSEIRRLLQAGNVKRANEFLGRPHFIRGRVVRGDARGRLLGFPTANLHNGDNLLPAHGVYVVRASWEAGSFHGVANIGRRPTFRGDTVRIEAHLLDFSGDIYGRTLRLEFLDRLRGERKFADIDALKAQIHRDIEAARREIGL